MEILRCCAGRQSQLSTKAYVEWGRFISVLVGRDKEENPEEWSSETSFRVVEQERGCFPPVVMVSIS